MYIINERISVLTVVKNISHNIWLSHLIPRVPIPPPPPAGHLSGVCDLVGSGGGEFIRQPLPGGGAFFNPSRMG